MTEFPTYGAASLDPEVASGPPWPRLVATSPDYRPPHLIKWPIIVGLLLYVAYIAMLFALSMAASHSAYYGTGTGPDPTVQFGDPLSGT